MSVISGIPPAGGCLRAVRPTPPANGCRWPPVVSTAARVLLVLATERGQLHVVTVDPGCGPRGGTLLAQVTVA